MAPLLAQTTLVIRSPVIIPRRPAEGRGGDWGTRPASEPPSLPVAPSRSPAGQPSSTWSPGKEGPVPSASSVLYVASYISQP